MFSRPRAPLKELPLLLLLASVQFTHIMDFMIMMPLGPQLMRELSVSPEQFSKLIAAYTLMAGCVGLAAAPFIDRFDRRTVLITVYAGFILGTISCALSHTAGQLLLARGVCGAFGGVATATILATVGDIVPQERRGAAMGIIMTSFSAAAAFGVPFGLFLAQKLQWEAPFFLLAGMAVLVEFMLLKMMPPVRGHLANGIPEVWKNFRELLSDPNVWRALMLTASLVFGHFTIIPFLSPHLVFNLHYPEELLAVMYVLGGVLTTVSAPMLGKLSDRFGRVRVFSYDVLVASIIVYTITHVGPTPVWLTLVLTGLFFIFASGRFVPAQAVMTSAVPSHRRGAFMSLSSCGRDLCTGLAALLAGKIVKPMDGRLLGVDLLGWVAVFFSLLSIWLIRRIKIVPEPPPKAEDA